MNRLTTDSPVTNFGVMMNYSHAESGRVILGFQGEKRDLCEFVEAEVRAKCGIDAESVMDGFCCWCGECAMSVINTVAIQAAELRSRLKSIEDILGDEYDLDHLRELVQAERDGRLVVPLCKVGDTVYEPNKRGFISTYKVISIHISACSTLIGWELIDGIYSNVNGFEASALGKTVFLTRKEAEAAMEARKGEE